VEAGVADRREDFVEREARRDRLADLVQRQRLAKPQVLRCEPLLSRPRWHDANDLFDFERLEDVVVPPRFIASIAVSTVPKPA